MLLTARQDRLNIQLPNKTALSTNQLKTPYTKITHEKLSNYLSGISLVMKVKENM